MKFLTLMIYLSEDLFFDSFLESLPKCLDPASNIIFLGLNSLSSYGLDNNYWVYCTDNDITDLMCLTPCGYTTMLNGGMDLLHMTHKIFLGIFDSGASKAISGFRSDFSGEVTPPPKELRLGGMSNRMLIERTGTIQWGFQSAGNTRDYPYSMLLYSYC